MLLIFFIRIFLGGYFFVAGGRVILCVSFKTIPIPILYSVHSFAFNAYLAAKRKEK